MFSCIIALTLVFEVGYRQGFERLQSVAQQKADYELTLQVQILESRLEKYRVLPVLISRHSDQSHWFDQQLPNKNMDTWLQQLSYLTGAFDVLVLNPLGEIIGSANKKVMAQYSHENLQTLANAPFEGRLGRQYIRINNETLLYSFSSHIANEQVQGVLAFVVDLSPVFQSWTLSSSNLIATDNQNIITLASHRNLIGKNSDQLSPFLSNNQYAQATIQLNTLGWNISAFEQIDNSTLVQQTFISMAFIIITIILVFYLLIKKREQQHKIIERDKQYAHELEDKIEARTIELKSTNDHLVLEIDERKHAEKQLRTTQQELIQSAKLAAIGQMSTTLSHEYNQPLATMRTYAENALRFLEMDRTDSAKDNLNRIVIQTDRLGSLSKVLMSFARKPTDGFSKVNLNACVEEAFMLVQPRIKHKNIELQHSIQKDLNAYGSAVQISQILLNLLTNAIDAIQEQQALLGNHLQTEQDSITINATSNEEKITLSVADSGPGISVEHIDQVFEPFYTSKVSGKGLGLGLSVVRDIVRDHKGTLTIKRSQLGGANIEIQIIRWQERK